MSIPMYRCLTSRPSDMLDFLLSFDHLEILFKVKSPHSSREHLQVRSVIRTARECSARVPNREAFHLDGSGSKTFSHFRI